MPEETTQEFVAAEEGAFTGSGLQGEALTNFVNLANTAQISPEQALPFAQLIPKAAQDFSGGSDGIQEFVRTHGLTEEQASALAGYEESYNNEVLSLIEQEVEKEEAEYLEAFKQDKVINEGGFEQNLTLIHNLIDDFGGQQNEQGINEFQQLMSDAGISSHPVLGRFLLGIAKALPKEGKFVGGNGAEPPKSFSDVINYTTAERSN